MRKRGKTQRLLTTDFNSIIHGENAGHTLAAINAKLTLMKRIHSARQRDNSMLRSHFDRSQTHEMLPSQKSLYPPFEIAVGKRDRFIAHKLNARLL